MIDIAIVTYNVKNLLKRCLESIERHTKDMYYSLTILDNATSDGTFEYLRRHWTRKAKIIRSDKNLGFPGGANLLIKNTKSPFLILMDDDIEVTKGWLSGLYHQIRSPNVGIVGGKVASPKNRIFSADVVLRPFGVVGRGELDRGQRNYIKECDALPGACWLMRRSVIKEVGDFDEQFFPSQYEDTDYCIRTRLLGFKIIYEGNVKIIHREYYRKGRHETKHEETNEIRLFKKWKETFRQFPLNDSNPYNKRLAEGVDFLERMQNKTPTRFDEMFFLNPPFTEAFFLGMKALKNNNPVQAISEFQNVLSSFPQDTIARYFLGVSYRRAKLDDKARKEASRVLRELVKNGYKSKRLFEGITAFR